MVTAAVSKQGKLRPVSLSELQEKNIRTVIQKNMIRAETMKGTWRGLTASGVMPYCGVSVGRLDPNLQSCRGQLVIPPYCPPPAAPTSEQRQNAGALRVAMIEALREAPTQTIQPTPLVHPGYRGERQPQTKTFVINGSAPAAIAAGIVLLAAAGGVPGAAALGITQVQVAGPTPTTLFSFIVPSGSSCQVERVTFTGTGSSGPTLFWQLLRSGRSITNEFQFTDSPTVDLQFPANGDETIMLVVRNPDITGAWIVRVEIDLWIWGTPTKSDDLYTRILRSSPSWPQNAPQRECVPQTAAAHQAARQQLQPLHASTGTSLNRMGR